MKKVNLLEKNMEASRPVYVDTLFLQDYLKRYASPKAKLTRMIRKGDLIRIKRGLYIWGDSKVYSLKTLANRIYGPSYVSFESALAYYQMIPEGVQVITSACFNSNKTKLFQTPLGGFIYRTVGRSVFSFEVAWLEEQGSPFLMATREKALCDTLSKMRDVTTRKGLTQLLFEDLRIDPELFASLNFSTLEFLAAEYHKPLLKRLSQYVK